jgi:hypothetical protein
MQLTAAWEDLSQEKRDTYGARAIYEESKMAQKIDGINFRARTKNLPNGNKKGTQPRKQLATKAARATYKRVKKAPKPNEIDIVDDGS